MNVKKSALATLICSLCLPVYGAQKTETSTVTKKVETIVVKGGTHLLRSDLDSLISSTLIEREQLDMMQANSLGETLKLTPGIHANYYGPSASRPIIRGLDGPRVKILQNGLSGGDASASAPDHQVSSEVSTATQIEVLRGPATLLHGSGAIGGVVNVIDERIPAALTDEITGEVIGVFTSVNDAKDAAFNIKGSSGSFAFYADGFVKDANETNIPVAIEHEEEGHDEHEEHEEHEEEGHDEHEEESHEEHDEHGRKIIENSQSRSDGLTIGSSYITDKFMLGLSYGRTSSKYGLVGHEHESHDEHDEEEGHHDEEEHEEHGDELLPWVETQQSRTQLNATWFNLGNNIDSISLKAAHVDYKLQEIEDNSIATQITNKSDEVKVQLHHRWFNEWQGIVGVHLQDSATTPVGEEANSPATKTTANAIFATQRRQIGDAQWHLGARVEQVDIKPQLTQDDALSNISFTPVSWAGGVDWALNKNQQLLVNLSHSQRALSASELFAFGEHLGTQSFDVGVYFNMNIVDGKATHTPTSQFNKLETENANTLDIGWRYSGDDFVFASSLFYSKVDNFSYQARVIENSGDLPIYQYRQANAQLHGGELQFSYFINDQLTFSSFIDYSHVALTSGEDLPRIPPLRISNTLNWEHLDWHYNIGVTSYAKQNKVGQFETPTKGYTLVDIGVYKHHDVGVGQLKYFLKINNLFDQEAHVHSSFLKDKAPLPGASVKLGMRWSF
jgi:iron complex outermembrane receptor protein